MVLSQWNKISKMLQLTIRVSPNDNAALMALPTYDLSPALFAPFHTIQLFRLHLIG